MTLVFEKVFILKFYWSIIEEILYSTKSYILDIKQSFLIKVNRLRKALTELAFKARLPLSQRNNICYVDYYSTRIILINDTAT